MFMALFGTNITPFLIMGISGLAYHHGYGVFGYTAAMAALIIPVAYYVIGYPAWIASRKLKAVTPAELLARRLDSPNLGRLLFAGVLRLHAALPVHRRRRRRIWPSTYSPSRRSPSKSRRPASWSSRCSTPPRAECGRRCGPMCSRVSSSAYSSTYRSSWSRPISAASRASCRKSLTAVPGTHGHEKHPALHDGQLVRMGHVHGTGCPRLSPPAGARIRRQGREIAEELHPVLSHHHDRVDAGGHALRRVGTHRVSRISWAGIPTWSSPW